VEIIEATDEIAKEAEMYIKPYIFSIIRENDVKVHFNAKLIEVKEKSIIVEQNDENVEMPFEAVVYAVGSRSNRELVDVVERLGIEYYIVGDAVAPSKLLFAIWGGNEIARKI